MMIILLEPLTVEFFLRGGSAFPYSSPKNNDELIDILSNRRHYLNLNKFDDRVLEIMRETDRGLFALQGEKDIYEDDPFKIGDGQTCSQPSMVAAMATLLRIEPGMKILEVGTGCGYSAAVTAPLLIPDGVLFTIEFIPELSEKAEETIKVLGREKNIRFIVGDGSVGLPDEAPFDRIYLTVGVGKGFNEELLLDQIKPGGILLYPEAHGSMYFVKKTSGKTERQSLGSVGFVFLKGKNSGF